jgi:hypothetical protein
MLLPNTQAFLNHAFFAVLLGFFVLQQGAFAPTAIKYGPVDVAKALNYQPRTPPPMLDADQLNTSIDEFELTPYHSPLR